MTTNNFNGIIRDPSVCEEAAIILGLEHKQPIEWNKKDELPYCNYNKRIGNKVVFNTNGAAALRTRGYAKIVDSKIPDEAKGVLAQENEAICIGM